MTNCKGCPFLEMITESVPRCMIGFVSFYDYEKKIVISKDCQLEIVQYAVKDKRDSITFIPEEE